jgi:acyl-CoA thioester hydrolase
VTRPANARAAPLTLHREPVHADWLDYNGHMNVAYYVLAFDHASDALADHIGIGHAYMQRTNCSIFILEAHVAYLREVVGGDPLRFETYLLGFDDKRIHYAHAMIHDAEGYHAATNELILLHVDLGARRGVAMPEPVRAALARIAAEQTGLAPPRGLSRVMGLGSGRF